ncbi:MAG: biopolymer transporter ExbD [Chthonomonadales bacterium]
MAEMNLIPLIDIALTLLIILMVTTAFVRQPGVSLKLPETKTREGSPETPKDLTIIVSEDGGLYCDGQSQTDLQVQSRLRELAKKDLSSRVLLKADRNSRQGRVMDVMDMARQAGLTKLVFPTDPKLTGQPTGAP